MTTSDKALRLEKQEKTHPDILKLFKLHSSEKKGLESGLLHSKKHSCGVLCKMIHMQLSH